MSLILNRYLLRPFINSNIISSLNVLKYSTNSKDSCERGETKPKKKVKTPKGRLDDNFDDAPPVFEEKEVYSYSS